MSEAKRFMRHVLPGLVILVQMLGALVFSFPQMGPKARALIGTSGGSVGVALATLIASGVVGYVFAMIYHAFRWALWPPDHRGTLRLARMYGFVHLWQEGLERRLESCDSRRQRRIHLKRRDTWALFNAVWHGHETKGLKAVNELLDRLTNIMHSIGSALAGSATVFLLLLYLQSKHRPSCEGLAFSLGLTVVWMAALVWNHCRVFRQIRIITRSSLLAALNEMHLKRPIRLPIPPEAISHR